MNKPVDFRTITHPKSEINGTRTYNISMECIETKQRLMATVVSKVSENGTEILGRVSDAFRKVIARFHFGLEPEQQNPEHRAVAQDPPAS